METSDAMDIEANVFKTGSAESIAESLKRSSTHSRRRKGTPFQSAMSMLNFYINRAGKNLPKGRRATLEQRFSPRFAAWETAQTKVIWMESL